MRALFFLLILVFTFFLSCRKNKELMVEIRGQVTNNGDNSPAAGVTVRVKFQEISSSSVSTAYKTVATVTTDANGNYEMIFEKPAAAAYRFELSSPRHFSVEFNESADAFSAKDANTRNFSLDPVSWFKVRLINSSPVGNPDQIIYQNTSENNSCGQCCANTPLILTGMAVDTTFVCQRKGGRYIKFAWTVSKAGGNTFFTDSILTPNYDTAFRQINY